ncbi:DUF2306 domain-containing protein [Winogradskyella haliclonae]|uniref:Membrane protein DUF2306 n=1 Tax=Winogradskyella haliclonae TaxID=2048558 RepID=A0ABQ2C1S8_9FLAO|nr:DUF2306 domain-containing protein [Winogradskyella haliclonae]GGI57723.1 hypothetical protein GCM10011444_20320 [Winogradskyella haliclonae]
MYKKISWILLGILSSAIGLYPLIYFIIDSRFGLLLTKPDELLLDTIWNIAFYGHIVFGGIALLIGWLQFNTKLRNKNLKLHRTIGKTYIISVVISGLCGIYIAIFATGGMVSVVGFLSLALIWLTSTLWALMAIKTKNIRLHQKLMIYSYAACFSAVTLRIWLPILISTIGFSKGYPIVAWLAWVPNIIVAYFIVNKKSFKTS